MMFQAFLIIFAVIALAKVGRQYQKRKVSVYWFIVWSILWMGVIAVGLSPQTTDVIAARVGVGRGADLLVYSSILILFYGLYRVMSRQEKLHQEITELVRKIAIIQAKKPDA